MRDRLEARKERQRGRQTRDRWEGRQETYGETGNRPVERQTRYRWEARQEIDGERDERRETKREID